MYKIIDEKTGEVVAENFIFIGRPRKQFDAGFIKVFVAFLDDLMTNKEIAGKAVRLLFYMMEHLNYNDLTVVLFPKVVMKELKIKRNSFYRWIKVLIKYKIIQKIDTHSYRITPYTFIKGEMKKTSYSLK